MFFQATTVVLALAASLPFVSAACSRSYTVQSGDTCNAISAKENVSTFQLFTNNPSINSGCTNLAIGQVLCLGNDGEDCTDTLVVEAGDFCDELISCAGINSTIFFLNNPTINSECTNLEIGQVVCVASQVVAPAMGAAPEPSSSASLPSAPATSAAAPVNVAPSPSVAASSAVASSAVSPSVHSSAPSSTPTDDDGDLPFCDEIDDEEGTEETSDSWN